ncbi:helix-turn-helix domain-containing protein [Collinsella tanakaei]|uniref:helix-turn-helix domain-containing protein n=2 Tax=Collinsella tanakaei TaxID=626935 RepID=UPI0025A477A5|nr:helix-turn-helix transcriptional regulator [Collinsella tanakaei]MDM8302618.1 helix-turn-helix transcriptional regulator [Collinsella tanakaei]
MEHELGASMNRNTREFEYDKATIGARIRDVRTKRGVSQEALAEALHVSRQTVSNWERGKTLIDVQSLAEMARALETTLPELLGEPEMRRMVERGGDTRRELMTIYVGLSLFVPAVILLEFMHGTAASLWFACALIPPAIWFSWRAFAVERDLGLRCAREVAEYIERGTLPKHSGRPRSFAAYIALGIGLWLFLEFILGLLS